MLEVKWLSFPTQIRSKIGCCSLGCAARAPVQKTAIEATAPCQALFYCRSFGTIGTDLGAERGRLYTLVASVSFDPRIVVVAKRD
jgi:hypothetical protein